MTRAILANLFALVAAAGLALAQPELDDALLVAARKALPKEISTNEIVRVLHAGLWNSNRTAVAAAFVRPKASLVFVFLRQTSGKYLVVDVSGVEKVNLGALGLAGYDRLETTPVRWLHRDDDLFQVVLRTRAWKGGQRYTMSEALIIKPDGTPLWR